MLRFGWERNKQERFIIKSMLGIQNERKLYKNSVDNIINWGRIADTKSSSST